MGEFGTQYLSQNDRACHDYELLGGSQISLRGNRVTVFVHPLVGGSTVDGSNTFSLSAGVGGGLDVSINERVGVRLIQFDWIPLRSPKDEEWFKNVIRFGFGIVIKP
jgi:hypothetical protein